MEPLCLNQLFPLPFSRLAWNAGSLASHLVKVSIFTELSLVKLLENLEHNLTGALIKQTMMLYRDMVVTCYIGPKFNHKECKTERSWFLSIKENHLDVGYKTWQKDLEPKVYEKII